MNRLTAQISLTLLLAMACCGTVLAASSDTHAKGVAPTYMDFARRATLQSPVISPDGKYLALSVHNEKMDEKGADWQLAVFRLPELKVVSRLNMAPRTQPLGVVWVSNTRLVMNVGRNTGTLEAPSATGEVVAVDYNGERKRTLYTPHSHGRSSIRSMMHLNMPLGYSSIEGLPDELDGHIFISVTPFKNRGTATSGSWKDGDSLLFDVDSVSGRAKEIGKIYRAGMSFVQHDGQARLAYGQDDELDHVVFIRSSDDKETDWKQLPESVTGKLMQPLHISRDGKTLYSLYSEHGEPTKLISSKPDGSDRKVLASDDFAAVSGVYWTRPPDLKPYAVVYDVGRPHVEYIDPDYKFAKLHRVLSEKFPDEFIDFAGASRDDNEVLVFAHSDRDPGSVALLDTGKMNLTPLYRVLPWINTQHMASTTPIRFKNRDGLMLDGYLTLPRGTGQKALPMVMYPHGGPMGPRDSWFYNPDTQFLASRGYAVLQVNFRGSGGRGFNFQRAGWGQFGTGIINDQIDGVRWAIDKGYADKNRICVYGGSFGGYSSLMDPIRAPDLFKCAIDYAGVSDLTVEFDRSDTRRYAGGRYYFEHAIGTSRANVEAISPIHHMDKFKVPVLIVHGEDDPRVPVQNAYKLRDALKKAGKPFEWLLKPKELHGFYSEANRAEMLETMDAFLDKYIGHGEKAQAAP